MAAYEEKKERDRHPLLHMTSKLDSRFSFNSDMDDDVNIQVDPIHKAVGRESWYQVSWS